MAVTMVKGGGVITINNTEKNNGFLTIYGVDDYTKVDYKIPGISARVKPQSKIIVWVDMDAPTPYRVEHILSIDIVGTLTTLLKHPDGKFRKKTKENTKNCLEAENKAFANILGTKWDIIKAKTGLGEIYK